MSDTEFMRSNHPATWREIASKLINRLPWKPWQSSATAGRKAGLISLHAPLSISAYHCMTVKGARPSALACTKYDFSRGCSVELCRETHCCISEWSVPPIWRIVQMSHNKAPICIAEPHRMWWPWWFFCSGYRWWVDVEDEHVWSKNDNFMGT